METAMQKPYAIGIDIGGTNTVMGIVDQQGNILATDAVKTGQYEQVEEYVEAVCAKLIPLIEEHGGADNFRGMGIGAPNANYYRGTIEQAPNLPWKGIVPLAEMFKQKIGIPVAMTNDANAAALGEMTYGAARGMKHFIMITLGTGVGSGIVIDGKMVYGHDGFAGELGHVCVDRSPEARVCGCGRRGCLETYCSATGVSRTAREVLTTSTEPSLLRDTVAEQITSKDVYDAAVKGDKLALEIFQRTGETLGRAIADFIVFSSPEAIVLFGGLSKAGEYIMRPIREAVDANVMPIFKGKAKIILSELKDADAAILGASALGWETK
ncbi:MAG: ROK family protein [Bacteroidaceae bacterium]|nr:ROK family protein [Bacteroidaceae bacterium]